MGVVGWCHSAGLISSAGRPTIWMIVGQGPIALTVGAGGGCLDIFILLCPFSPLSPSLWETARYRLKYCLKEPLNLKQPTNQPRFARLYEEIIHLAKARGLSPVQAGKPWYNYFIPYSSV